MRTFEEKKRLYAKLIIKFWLNLQSWQNLILNTPIEAHDFVKLITEEAYAAWAKNIFYRRKSDELSAIRYKNAPEEVFWTYPERIAQWYTKEVKNNCAVLSLYMNDSALFKSVNPEHIKKDSKTNSLMFKEYKNFLVENRTNRCIVSIPTKWWANTIYNSKNNEENVMKLREQIFKLVRINEEDPIKARENHIKNLNSYSKYLNEKKFKKLHYRSKKTDLTIELPKNHQRLSAWDKTKTWIHFCPNMPTEEVFSMPHKYWVNGKVYSTFPLQHDWKLIKNFWFTFKDWEVVDFEAEEWYEILKSILESDKNSKRLWEVAIVPTNSPIYESWLIYYNTLFDENASCHLALWTSYSTTLIWSEKMTPEERDKAWMNQSIIHVDFMVWDESLTITWETYEEEKIEFFVNWKWNID